MNEGLVLAVTSTGALAVGGAIGFLFGVAQNIALAHNRKMKGEGRLHAGWGAMPGSMSRVAVLLVALAAVQLFCPMFFQGNIQWLVSAGLLLGYGVSFLKKLQQRAGERV